MLRAERQQLGDAMEEAVVESTQALEQMRRTQSEYESSLVRATARATSAEARAEEVEAQVRVKIMGLIIRRTD
jgi:hypothetical protein